MTAASTICKTCGNQKQLGKDCRKCANRRNAEYKLRHADKVKADRSAYKKRKHAENAAVRLMKKEQKRATVQARKLQARKKWKLLHPGNVNECTARRFAAKMQATPVWANRFFMQEIYALAALRTKMLGFKWHVDHIVPLRSKLVCGLHVEQNLRVIPAVDNMHKGNRIWPDMPVQLGQEKEQKSSAWVSVK